jgi:hypothetical protein
MMFFSSLLRIQSTKSETIEEESRRGMLMKFQVKVKGSLKVFWPRKLM